MIATLALFGAALSLAHEGPHVPAENVNTLYRSSVLDGTMRIHIATFDTNNSGDYNSENCTIARDLFLNQPGVNVAYWCERGYVRDDD